MFQGAASWYWSMRDSQLSNFIITKKWLQHKCFPVNFTKFLKTPFLQNTFEWGLVFKKLLPRWFPHIKLLTFILIIWQNYCKYNRQELCILQNAEESNMQII